MRKTCAMEAGHAGFVRARESVEGEVVQELAYGVEKYCACGFAESGRIWRRRSFVFLAKRAVQRALHCVRNQRAFQRVLLSRERIYRVPLSLLGAGMFHWNDARRGIPSFTLNFDPFLQHRVSPPLLFKHMRGVFGTF